MKHKTAMQWFLEEAKKQEAWNNPIALDTIIQQAKQKEKEQIIEAYDRGKYYSHNRNPREYYNSTYKQD